MICRISMVLDGGQLADQWRRCSITADFWARYIALYIPTEAGPTRLQRSAMSDVLSYLLNELLKIVQNLVPVHS
ncbi:MAG: hypothetical protein R2932_44875 [Caldilineaceae bacterium]